MSLILINNTNNSYIDVDHYFKIFIKNIILADRYLKTKQRNKYKIQKCNQCSQCLQKEDCLICINCLNKPKLGGNGTRKQGCIFKRCLHPTKFLNY